MGIKKWYVQVNKLVMNNNEKLSIELERNKKADWHEKLHNRLEKFMG